MRRCRGGRFLSMSREEWQARLDRLFPYGLRVTKIDDVVEYLKDSPSFFTTRLRVTGVQGETAEILCFPLSFQLDVRFQIVSMEPCGRGWWVHTPKPPGWERDDFFLDTDFSAETARELRAVHDGESRQWLSMHTHEEPVAGDEED